MSSWLGLRHVALNVRDVAISVDFYQRILGMRLEWMPDPENAYLTSGADNLALHQSPQGNQMNARDPTLDHFGFVVRRPEDVDEWAQRLLTSGVQLEKEPKNHRDGARSLYFRDPDRNLIQIIYHPPISNQP